MAKRALCIGINSYPGTGGDLAGCVNDAEDWAARLEALGYQPSLLLDGKATGTNIRAALRYLMQEARHWDRLVITFSGHGSYVPDQSGDEPDGVDECWCASDIATSASAYITDDELATMLKARAADVRVAVLSDSCFSGTMTRFFTPTPGAAVRRIRFLPPKTFLPDAKFAKLRTGRAYAKVSNLYPAVLLAGCQEDEYSYDAWFGDRPNGAFTRAALDTYKAGMSYRAWQAAIRQVLPSRDYPQTPNLRAGWWQKFWSALG